MVALCAEEDGDQRCAWCHEQGIQLLAAKYEAGDEERVTAFNTSGRHAFDLTQGLVLRAETAVKITFLHHLLPTRFILNLNFHGATP